MARGLAVAVVAARSARRRRPRSGRERHVHLRHDPGGHRPSGERRHHHAQLERLSGGLCPMQVTLKSFPSPTRIPNNYTQWTLTGRTGMNDGFDGTGLTGRVMTGVDVHRLELQDLTFRDSSSAGNGGALDITGESSVGLRQLRVLQQRRGRQGRRRHTWPGAAGARRDARRHRRERQHLRLGDEPRRGQHGGHRRRARDRDAGSGQNSGINGSTFANNVARGERRRLRLRARSGGSENFSLDGNVVVDNKAGGSGGGGYVVVANAFLSVDGNTFEGNSVEHVHGHQPAGDHFGGGLYLDNGILRSPPQRLHGQLGERVPERPGLRRRRARRLRRRSSASQSQFTRFEGNTSPDRRAPSRASRARAAGCSSRARARAGTRSSTRSPATRSARCGEGGGIYTGAAGGHHISSSARSRSPGNSVGAGGQFAGHRGRRASTT